MAFLTDEERKKILLATPKKFGAQPNQEVKVDVTLNDIESFGNDESVAKMQRDLDEYEVNLREKLIFINQPLSDIIPFTRQNLYLICAYTGNGKSTIAANVSYPLLKQKRKVLVLSNEEPAADVLMRIACIELGINFNDFKKGSMSEFDKQRCQALFPEISKYIKVVDVAFQHNGIEGLTVKLEGVKSLLMNVQNEKEYACVMLDYYQLVQYSMTDPSRSRYDVLNDLRIWLGRYIKSSNIPVVIFAQLHSADKRKTKELDGRIKECPAIVETASVIVEVIPNFKDLTTEFLIHKDRFGFQGRKLVCSFQKGRYVAYDPNIKKAAAEQDLARLQESMQKKDDGDFGQVMAEAVP